MGFCFFSKWCFFKTSSDFSIFLLNRSELLGQVNEVRRINEATSKILAMTINVVTIKELIIKDYNDFVICLSNNSTSVTKRNVFSSYTIYIHNSIANFKVFNFIELEWKCPEWELFLENHVWFKVFNIFTSQFHLLIMILNHFTVSVYLSNKFFMKGIKSHFNIRHLRYWKFFKPLGNYLNFVLCNLWIIVLIVEVFKIKHTSVLSHCLGNTVNNFWE